jgi:hypothetical protein
MPAIDQYVRDGLAAVYFFALFYVGTSVLLGVTPHWGGVALLGVGLIGVGVYTFRHDTER